jgi:putative FmdB family regulatory protein
MPLYRYRCGSCGNEFTVLVRQGSDGNVVSCPECGSNKAQRVVSRVAVQFKGSGYYKTDYARRGKSRSGNAANDSRQKETSSSEDTPSADSKADNSKIGSGTSSPQPSKSPDKHIQHKRKVR